jgi:hypothetical protein
MPKLDRGAKQTPETEEYLAVNATALLRLKQKRKEIEQEEAQIKEKIRRYLLKKRQDAKGHRTEIVNRNGVSVELKLERRVSMSLRYDAVDVIKNEYSEEVSSFVVETQEVVNEQNLNQLLAEGLLTEEDIAYLYEPSESFAFKVTELQEEEQYENGL